MSTLATIRTELADALNSVSNLSAYAYVTGQVNTPAVVIAPEGVEYDTTFDGGATYRLPLQFLVSLGDWGTAQRVIDDFIDHDGAGATAIYTADLEVRIVGGVEYGLTTFGDKDYLGAQVTVEVIV